MWRFNCFSREKSENKEILERASAVLTRARLIDIESALVSKRWLYLRPLAHFWTQSCGRVKVIRIRQCGWISISQQACGLLDLVGEHIFFSLSLPIASYFVYSQVSTRKWAFLSRPVESWTGWKLIISFHSHFLLFLSYLQPNTKKTK